MLNKHFTGYEEIAQQYISFKMKEKNKLTCS